MRNPPLFLFGAVAMAAAAAAPAQPSTLEVIFVDNEGREIGTAALTEASAGGVLIDVEIDALPSGEHGFHIHESGRCEGDFSSAGGHYNPTGGEHGYLAGQAAHAGDMPNQFVGENGKLRAHVFNPKVSFSGGEAPLLDDDGSALVVHANADDYRSQPSGDAGSRIACAVIEGA